MKRFFAILLALLFLSLCPLAGAAGVYGLAKQKLATRTGPGTTYSEGGTYNVAGQYILVLSRAWDDRNGIWWVKCEIPYHGETRVLWTGYKRFDSSTIPLESIPIEGESPSGSSSAQNWRSAYQSFISSGQYRRFLSNPNREYNTMLQQRTVAYDAFALHDLNQDGVPELIVETVYGIEQADVFTWTSSGVSWLGMMGGDNFFQDIVYYPGSKYPQLFALTGGPAINIDAYSMSGYSLQHRSTGRTKLDSNGDYYVDVIMNYSDSGLYNLLYDYFVRNRNVFRSLYFYSLSDLQTSSQWASFFSSAT